MKFSWDNSMIGAALIAGLFTFTSASSAFSEDAPAQPEKASALLEKVKQQELERQIVAKQTEINRLKEDLEKTRKDADGLQQTIDSTNGLVNQSTENLDQLSASKRRLEQALNLTIARMEAERRRIEGLRNLSAAQGKSLGAITKRIDEGEVRSRVRAAEMKLLTDGKAVPADDTGEKGATELGKLRKALATSEIKAVAEEKLARDAMKTAAAKVQLADEAAARAKRLAETVGVDADEAPEPVAEKPAEVKPPQAKPAEGKTAAAKKADDSAEEKQ